MKVVYTILFFLNTLVLIFLTLELLKMIDRGIKEYSLVVMLLAISVSIGFLVYFLFQYLYVSRDENKN